MKKLFLLSFLLIFSLPPAFALGCNPGTSECVDNASYRVCSEQALWGDPVICDMGMECVSGTCQEPIGCNPGTRQCLSTTTYRVCGSHAIWEPVQDCTVGSTCSNGYCNPVPQCSVAGQTRCAPDGSNTVQVCDSNLQWQVLKTCDYGCNAGYCRACAPASTRCSDSTHYQTCASDGTWNSDDFCGKNMICSSGRCIPNPAIVCNTPGSYQCSPSSSYILQRCGDNYQWADYQSCQLGCSQSACRVCSSGQTKCKDASTYYMCTSSGQWGLDTSCPTGYVCLQNSCQIMPNSQCGLKGSKRCSPQNPSMLQVCSDSYAYIDSQLCDNGCFDGRCAECKPGSSYCSGANTYRTCSQNGQLSDPINCSSGYACENGGVCTAQPQCTDGQRNCISDSVYSCVGGKWSLLLMCPQDTNCVEQQGTAICQQEAKPAPSPAPAPAPTPSNDNPFGPIGIYFVFATIVLGAAAYYFYSRKK